MPEVGLVVLQVLGTGMAALTQMDIGAIFAYPGVTLPQLLDKDSDDLIFTTTQAALFGGCTRSAVGEESSSIIIQSVEINVWSRRIRNKEKERERERRWR